MKRIKIIKNNIVTNQAELPDNEAQAWLAQGIVEHWFGAPAVFERQYNEMTGEFEEVEVTPAEAFEVVEEDITAELGQNRLEREAKISKKQQAKTALEAFKKNPASANNVAALRLLLLELVNLVEE